MATEFGVSVKIAPNLRQASVVIPLDVGHQIVDSVNPFQA